MSVIKHASTILRVFWDGHQLEVSYIVESAASAYDALRQVYDVLPYNSPPPAELLTGDNTGVGALMRSLDYQVDHLDGHGTAFKVDVTFRLARNDPRVPSQQMEVVWSGGLTSSRQEIDQDGRKCWTDVYWQQSGSTVVRQLVQGTSTPVRIRSPLVGVDAQIPTIEATVTLPAASPFVASNLLASSGKVNDDSIVLDGQWVPPFTAKIVGVEVREASDPGRRQIQLRLSMGLLELPDGVPAVFIDDQSGASGVWPDAVPAWDNLGAFYARLVPLAFQAFPLYRRVESSSTLEIEIGSNYPINGTDQPTGIGLCRTAKTVDFATLGLFDPLPADTGKLPHHGVAVP